MFSTLLGSKERFEVVGACSITLGLLHGKKYDDINVLMFKWYMFDGGEF